MGRHLSFGLGYWEAGGGSLCIRKSNGTKCRKSRDIESYHEQSKFCVVLILEKFEGRRQMEASCSKQGIATCQRSDRKPDENTPILHRSLSNANQTIADLRG